jgi:tripartite-type tricarboxylate transporter receptor subunit TctC
MSHLIARRTALHGLSAAGLAACLPAAARQSLPAVARILNGFPAGGSVDAVCRRVAEVLRGGVAETVIVDNRPGAGGRIAIDALRNGPGDGSQWLVTPGSMLVIYPHVYKKLAYDPVRDLVPVALLAQVPLAVAVGPAVPASVQDLRAYVQWLKANPGSANVGTPAAGNITHFLAFLLGRSAGVQLQYVPFRGSAPAVQDLLGGQIPAVINPLTEMLPYLGSGRLRILAVTSRSRSAFVPQVPTCVEQGHPDVVGSEWVGLFAKTGTPAAAVDRMGSSLRVAMENPAVKEALAKLALEPAYETGGRLATRIGNELAGWREVSRVFGFHLEE